MRALSLLAALTLAAPAAAQQNSPDYGPVYDLHEVEVLPRPQNAAEFTAALHQAYPPHLRAAGVGGTVQVAFVVGTDGQPKDVRVVSASDSAFSGPSAQAVSLLRFTPAQLQARPVAVRVEQPITWRTEAPPPAAAAEPAPAAPPAADADAFELSAVETLPRVLNRTEFGRALAREYPPALRRVGREGYVQVRFKVEMDGTTSNAFVTRASDPEFVEPTLRAITVLRFAPALVNGNPVKAWVEQPINWTVAQEPAEGIVPLPNRPMFGRPPGSSPFPQPDPVVNPAGPPL